MTIDKAALAAEIANDPQSLGYGTAQTPDDDQRIANLMNAKSFSGPVTRMVTARAIIAELGMTVGTTILEKMVAAQATQPALKWVLKFLEQDAGIDIGHPTTQGAIDALTAGGLFTAAEGAALKGMAFKAISRAEVLWGHGASVMPGDVSHTRS